MSIPLLEVTPTTQNQRVPGYEVPDEDDAKLYRLTDATSETAIQELIWAGYRQIFSEHLILESYRQLYLESQLRNRAITVRDFIRGLGKSDVYRNLVGDTNSNYRLVDISFKRFLGRATYNQGEQIAWSIVIATKGLAGFIDAIVDSDEYRQSFGDYIVPYQRRRFNERPFNLVNPRYSDFWRNRESLRFLEGRSYYQVRQTGESTRPEVQRAIPNTFLAMAQSIAPAGASYQRTSDRARGQVATLQLADTTQQETAPKLTVKPVKTALPYRYLPTRPTV
jgi:phycobilisome rod-core linker protein